MKKSKLILLTIVPLIMTRLFNFLLLVPVLGTLSFYVAPLVTTVFWYWLGKQYARGPWKPVPAILIAHAIGICSLLVYLWQFVLQTSETRNAVLASFSQAFASSAPLYLVAPVAGLLPWPQLAMQVIGLVYMILVFCIGMYVERHRV